MSAFLQDAARLLEKGTGWAGLPGDALAFVLSEVAREGRWLLVADEPDRAGALLRALAFFHPRPERVLSFPADDTRPYDGFSPHPSVPIARLRTLRVAEKGEDCLVVAPVAALMQRVPDRETRRRGTREIAPGDRVVRDELTGWLTDAGYLATSQVKEPGCFAVRGDLVDVWCAGLATPVRIDLFGDEVEELRRFDADTQRTLQKVASLPILPVREERLDAPALERAQRELARLVRAQGRGVALRRHLFEDWKSGVRASAIGDWLPVLVPTEAPLEAFAGFRTIAWLPEDIAASARAFERLAAQRWEALDDEERPLVPPSERYVASEAVLASLATGHAVHELASDGASVDLGARSVDGFSARSADLGSAVSKLRALADNDARVGLVVRGGERTDAILEMLAEHALVPRSVAAPRDLVPGEVGLIVGDLRHGFVAAASGWSFVPAEALFGRQRRAGRTEALHAFWDAAVSSLAQIKEGDAVVHRLHGVGLYRGLKRLDVHGVQQDFVALEYRDGDRMYLPVTALDQLSRYTASRVDVPVRLDRLGGVTWSARTRKVRDSLLSMASELLSLYARREIALRPPHPPPGPMTREFESRFPFEETPDQGAAIDAVHEDLSAAKPADRLICGDVGFGKTEVAMRAAMRVVEGGRQVAVLCPTTVLAYQHLQTFTERFAPFPVAIEMLSRFRTGADEKRVLEGLAAGTVHVAVGTTRLLGRAVRFRDLGLLVVDEEHRFGVRQKERLKRMRAGLDVISMSATPIPRTLEMALSGMRDLSVMATPPTDRLSVRTSVARLSRTRVRDAVALELERGGQVFYVHNRVETIERAAERLREWVPEARIAVAHGQMDDEALERVLVEFIQKRVDVLVCSSIVESGVDLPNVNTMIVERADTFGLAQLYQLRGRVGRAAVRANCVLLTPETLNRDAAKRLRTLTEHTDLGSGFQIAAADLEMRGGGNLFGEAQSGNIDEVGYEMWVELLGEAVAAARGDLERSRIDPEIEVPVPAFLPESYLPDVPERLEWYRRLSSAEDADEVDRILDEMEDLHGELPVEARNLAGVFQTRALCRELGIVRCSWLKVRVLFELHPSHRIPRSRLDDLFVEQRSRFTMQGEKEGPEVLSARFTPGEAERPFQFLRWVLARLGRD